MTPGLVGHPAFFFRKYLLQYKPITSMLKPQMTTGVELSERDRAKMAEWGRKGGQAGRGEAKRRGVLKAWANPDPSKRPGRKKGTPNRAPAPRPANAFNALMEELSKP